MALSAHVTVRKRVACFFLCAVLIMGGLTVRLAYIQFFRSRWLTENAVEQRIREIPVEARRGSIFDRQGRELGVSISRDSVYAIPAEITDADETAAKLAAIFTCDASKLKEKLKKRQAFVWLERKVEPETAQAIRSLNLPGIGLTQENRRYYPYGNLAAHILGFTGIDSQGLDGVELTFDQYLKGRSGSIVVEYDARGREIPYAHHRFVKPADGHDVYLTIDLIMQQIVERELERIMQDTGAKGSCIIVLDPTAGEILAMANRPDYNPNAFGDYPPGRWRNNALANTYEPGSTFKIITAAAALSEQAVNLEERFFDPGSVEVQGREIHCWKAGGHGSESFQEVVENSCNVGFVQVGLKLGSEGFYKYLDAFGLGRLTDVELAGEAKGIVINKAKVKPLDLATMSMGQSIAVTPLQLAVATAAVANDGLRLKPQIVKEVRSRDGEVLRSAAPEAAAQVISPAVARQLKAVLQQVVEKGTGKGAWLEGFSVGGKTGTAQKVGAGGYQAGKYIASFVGFTVEGPPLVVLVVIDEPVGLYYGGQIAAPAFAGVMKDLLQYLQATPRRPAKAAVPVPEKRVPEVVGLTATDALKVLGQAGFKIRLEPGGSRIVRQVPAGGSSVSDGITVLLYTAAEENTAAEVTVPDCRGRAARELPALLGAIGLGISQEGYGETCRTQDPPPGTKAAGGTVVRIVLE